MKNIKLFISSVVISVLPALASAQMNLNSTGNGNVNGVQDIGDLLDKIEMVVANVFGTLAVICIVVAGILFLTAAGNPDKVQQARNAFLWGIVGIIVGIIAYSILGVINSMLG